MVAVNLLSYTAAGGTATRNLAVRASDVINVKDYGAVGNGVANDTAALQAAFNTAMGQPAGHGINYHLNKPVFIPAGIYLVDAPLVINNTWGAHVSGAGMTSTIIQNQADGETVLSLNGVGYSTFAHMRLEAGNDGIACEYNWDGGGMSAQLVTFYKMTFGSVGGHRAAYGCQVALAGAQCDTSSWIDCVFGADVGISVDALNAISNRIVGGNLQSCRIGIEVIRGAFQTIAGVGFQLSEEWDIYVQGGATDAYHISGISTESTNFFGCGSTAVAATLSGCAQRSSAVGVFAQGQAILNIEGCQSKAGRIAASGRNVTIKNSSFWQIDALPTPTWAGAVWKIENSLFGLDEGSVARRELDTIITSTGKRTRGVEGTSLTANSVVNAGEATNNDDGGSTFMFPIEVSIASPAVCGSSTRWISSALDGPNRHGFIAGTTIAFTTTGALPTGISVGTNYYVHRGRVNAHHFPVLRHPGRGCGSHERVAVRCPLALSRAPVSVGRSDPEEQCRRGRLAGVDLHCSRNCTRRVRRRDVQNTRECGGLT